MISKIKQWFYDRKAEAIANKQKARQKHVKAIFNIEEHDGNVFIMCDNVAILRVAPNATIASLLVSLNKAREAAMEYDEL